MWLKAAELILLAIYCIFTVKMTFHFHIAPRGSSSIGSSIKQYRKWTNIYKIAILVILNLVIVIYDLMHAEQGTFQLTLSVLFRLVAWHEHGCVFQKKHVFTVSSLHSSCSSRSPVWPNICGHLGICYMWFFQRRILWNFFFNFLLLHLGPNMFQLDNSHVYKARVINICQSWSGRTPVAHTKPRPPSQSTPLGWITNYWIKTPPHPA